jgi:hypothetical protein
VPKLKQPGVRVPGGMGNRWQGASGSGH